MVSRAIIVFSVLFFSYPAISNDILGFKIGSTLDEAKSVGRQIKMELQDISFGITPDYKLFSIGSVGPMIGFCKNRLVMIDSKLSASFHEYIFNFDKNLREFGQPRAKTYQTYAGGMQLSSLSLDWPKTDGVSKTLSISNFGGGALEVREGFFQPNPCSP